MEEPEPEPYKVDKFLVASLPRSVASALRRQTRSWTDPVYGHDFEVTGYTLDGPIPSDDLTTARTMIERCFRPAQEREIKMLLAELRVATKARAEHDDDLVLGFQLYADELAKHPADVATAAVKKIARREKFYPALAELREQLLRESKTRRHLRDALK